MTERTQTENYLDEEDDTAARLASQAAQAPLQIEGYRIEEVLGKGSFGTVWSATQERTGRKVAIKGLELRAGQKPEVLKSEIEQMVKAGRHPHLLEILDARVQANRVFLICPLCHESLTARVAREPEPTAQEYARWMLQSAQALRCLHHLDIIHSDFKPDNCLLDAQGRLLVADLGQAHTMGSQAQKAGSFFYMPPEQAEGYDPSPAWDIYAWGATFVAAMTGLRVRDSDTMREVLREPDVRQRLVGYARMLRQTPLPKPDLPVDKRLAKLLYWCLETDPARRCPSMDAVMEELERPKVRWDNRYLLPLLTLPLLASALTSGLLGELAWWFALSTGVLIRVLGIAALAGAAMGTFLELGRQLSRRR